MARFIIPLLSFAFLLQQAPALAPEDQMQFADGLYVRGLYDLALAEYLKLSREAEDFARMDLVLYRIGECHRRLDNIGAAERFYLRVLREHPDSAVTERARFRRAEAVLTRGRYGEAHDLFQAFLDDAPPETLKAPALYYRGYAAKRDGRAAAAERDFQTVLDTYPDAPFASLAALDLAALYADQPDRASDALALYARAASEPATPEVGAEAVFQQAEWFFGTADYEESATQYARLLSAYPDSARAEEARRQAAWAFYNAGRYAEGQALAEQALDDPAQEAYRAEWLYVLANCRRQLLKTDEARATYERLLDEHPDHELAQVASYEVALLAFRDDEFDTALARVEGIEPDEALRGDLYWLLAESYAGVGRDDEAVQYYRLLLDAEPDEPRAPKVLYRLGRLLQARGDYPDAARTYRRLAEEYPEDALAPQGLFAAAFCMAATDRYEEAAGDWDALLERYPDHARAPEARYQLALAEMQRERDDRARSLLSDFVERHGDTPFIAEAHYWLGVLQEREEAYADAERSLRAALEAGLTGERAGRAQFRLALMLQRQDQKEEAADLLQGLLDTADRGPFSPALLEWLAVYRLDAGEYEAAAPAAQALQETGDTAAWRQIGWALLGRARQGAGHAAGALEAFEQSLAIEARTREGAVAALQIGRLKLDADDHAGAVPYLERAAELASEDELIDLRARAYFELGRTAERAQDWDRASRLFLSVGILFDDPELTPESLARAADALGRLGRETEREHTLAELEERYPEWESEE